MLKLVVCIKQVPMVTELPWDEKTGTLRRDLAAGMMNPACKHALEAALQIKEKFSAKITVITMGPPAAEEVLREALALGADEAILICDRLLAGSDTYATSLILKEAIKKKCPKFDLDSLRRIYGGQRNRSGRSAIGRRTGFARGGLC